MHDTVAYFANGMAARPFRTNPRLIRSGFVSRDYMEMTPVVFRERLLLLGSAQAGARANPFPDRCLWIEDVATRQVVATFAEGYGLGSAFVHDDTFYAFAIPNDSRGAQRIDCFSSKNLRQWERRTALRALPGEELFNESVCRAGDRFIMAFESRDAHYPPFTIYFAESGDLRTWTRLPGHVYGTDRYTACPTIRYLDGMFRMLYLEQFSPRWWFETYLTRSRDLIRWEQSPKNPVLEPEDVEDVNASDLDLVEFQGKVRAYYMYGDQRGRFGTTWAEFDGRLNDFYEHYF